MYIEDLLLTLCNRNYLGHYVNSGVRTNNFDSPVITSLGNQILMNNGLTEKQFNLAVKLCKKYYQQLNSFYKTDILEYITSPTNRIPLRTFSQERAVRVVTVENVKYFELKFPYDRELIEKLRNFKHTNKHSHAIWNDNSKTWRMSYDEGSLAFIMEELTGYAYDDDTVRFVEQYKQVLSNFEQHVIILTKKDQRYIVNHKFGYETTDLLESLVNARKYQIPVIDDSVIKEIDDLPVDDITKVMLAMPTNYSFQTNKKKYSNALVLNSMLVHNEPLGIVLNEGTSSQTLVDWIYAIQEAGIEIEQVGVFFRQENNTPNQRFFNSVIKEYKLNKPVSQNLKVYILGPKYNKSLIKEGVKLRYFICDDHTVTAHHNMQLMLSNSMLTLYHLDQEKAIGETTVVL
jgi:hypothetical protein